MLSKNYLGSFSSARNIDGDSSQIVSKLSICENPQTTTHCTCEQCMSAVCDYLALQNAEGSTLGMICINSLYMKVELAQVFNISTLALHAVVHSQNRRYTFSKIKE